MIMVFKIDTNRTIKFIDLFGGVGGFRLGLKRASNSRTKYPRDRGSSQNIQDNGNSTNGEEHNKHFECVWYNDYDKYAVQTYNKNFGENHRPTDIRTIKVESIPDFDMLCGGFPCQSFSIAGKRKGFEDTRGTLFFEIARIAKEKKPRLLLLENVRGLLSHDKGLTFQVILETLDELGYDVEWQVLNSKHFGVPQNRQRVFIIGHLRGAGGQKVFPITKDDIIIDEKGKRQLQKAQISGTITSTEFKQHGDGTYVQVADFRNDEGLRIRKNMKSPTLTSHGDSQGGIPVPMVISPTSTQRRHSETDVSTMPPLVIKNKIRRLTPTECERLQGFHDNWTQGVSDTQRYKQMGNAVTVNVIEAIGRKILKSVN